MAVKTEDCAHMSKSRARRLRDRACKATLFDSASQAAAFTALQAQVDVLANKIQDMHWCVVSYFGMAQTAQSDGFINYDGSTFHCYYPPESAFQPSHSVSEVHEGQPSNEHEESVLSSQVVDKKVRFVDACSGTLDAGTDECGGLGIYEYADEDVASIEAEVRSQVGILMTAVESYVSAQMTKLRGTYATRWPPIEGLSELEARSTISSMLVSEGKDVIADALQQELTDDQTQFVETKLKELVIDGFDDWRRFVEMNTSSTQHGAVSPQQVPSVATSTLKSLTKRGMAQPGASGKKNRKQK